MEEHFEQHPNVNPEIQTRNTFGTSNADQPQPKKEDSFVKKTVLFVWEIIKILIIAAIIVLPIRYFLFQPFIVKGDSMVPNFASGDYLIVDELSYRLTNPHRGDVVVLKYPLDITQRFIKRVIGLPGDTVDVNNGKVTITENGGTQTLNETSYLPGINTAGSVHTTLGPNDYFVMGDNRPFSYDSRSWGVLPKDDIIGRAMIRLYPFSHFSFITHPSY